MTRILVAALLWAGLAQGQADNTRRAKAHFKLGQAFYEAADYPKAIEEYLTSYQLVPLAPLLFNIAQAYRQSGDLPHALEYYEKYLDAQPDAVPSPEARRHVLAIRDAMRAAKALPSPAPVVAPSPLPDPEATRQMILNQLLEEERVKREKEAAIKLAEKRRRQLEHRRDDAREDRRVGIAMLVVGGVVSIAAAAVTGVGFTNRCGCDSQLGEQIMGPMFLVMGQVMFLPGTILLPRGVRNLATLPP